MKKIAHKIKSLLNINAEHAYYSQWGKWYNISTIFPAALIDTNGYIVFRTKADYISSPYLTHGAKLNIREE